jgi:hypothetical protein
MCLNLVVEAMHLGLFIVLIRLALVAAPERWWWAF